MNIRMDDPLWLFLAGLIVPCAAVGLLWLGVMSAARRWSALILRAAFLILLALALAGLATSTRVDRLATIAVVDVSGSVRRFANAAAPAAGVDMIEAVRGALATASRGRERRPDDLFGVVAFDGRAQTIAAPGRGDWSLRALDPPGGEGTDIAGALRLAAAMVPPDAVGRLVLVSDGNQTAGDAVASVTALNTAPGGGGQRLPVDVIPLEYDLTGEVMVESLDAPPRAPESSRISLRATLIASAPVQGVLKVFDNDTPVAIDGLAAGEGRRISLEAGRRVEVIDVELSASRTHRFRVVFEPDPGSMAGVSDRFTENNSAEAFTFSPGRGSVLLVDGVSDAPGGAGAAASPLVSVFERNGMNVQIVAPAGVPADLLSFEPFDVVLLDNVPADALPEGVPEALASFVREMGGGLVMIGGPASFGAGGWKGTPIEPLLPVRLDLPERLMIPEVAIAFVLDCSGSMRRSVMGSARSQQQIANESAALALGALDRRDLVSVIRFDDRAELVVPIRPNDDSAEIAAAIRRIQPDGGTDALTGLELAEAQLEDVEAKLKHIIVLSDGRSKNADVLPDFCARLAEKGIKVSTISVGDQADLATMDAMAQRGGGVSHNVSNPNILPRVFAKAVRVVRTPMIREEPFEPVILDSGSPLTAGLPTPPILDGLTLTQARAEPTVINAMATPQGEPLLAHWTAELGQVVAFTSDARRWASQWLDWPGYERFWLAVVRQVSRSAGPRGVAASAEIRDGRLVLRADDPQGSGVQRVLQIPASVYAPNGGRRDVTLEQVAPGRYETTIPLERTGTFIAILKPADAGRRLAPAVVGATAGQAEEFRRFRSDAALLASIAEASGGRVIPLEQLSTVELFQRDGVLPRYAVSGLWRGLLMAAIGVLLLDIATRRIAWDRLLSEKVGVPARAGPGGVAALRRPASSPDAGLALSEQDAARLRAAAKDRRRSQRLAHQPPSTDAGAPGGAKQEKPLEDTSGLLAAKRRAAQRFEDDADTRESDRTA